MSQPEQKHYLEQELMQLLRSDESVFSFLQKGSLDGLWYWDLEDQHNEWMSPEFWHTLGYDPAQKSHKVSEWQDIIFQEDLAQCIENFNKHCDDPSHPYDQVVRYQHADGSTVWIRCRGLAIRDENGKPVRMLGAHQDITELKQAELNIKAMQARFELAAEGASVGIWDWVDVEKSEEIWTPKFYELLGYAPNEITASLENFRAFLHPGDQAHTFAAVNRHFEENTPFDVEYRLKTKSGEYKWFRGTGIASRDESGKPQRMVGSIQDIHSSKLYEDELERTIIKLKQSNDDLERFAYVASHDLQEPLRVVTSYVQLLTRRYRDRLDKNAADFCDYIVDGCSRMQKLINDLLEFSRVGRDKLEKQKVDLQEIVESVKQSLARQIDLCAAIVSYENLPVVRANSAQIERLMQNLVSNSLKYKRESVPPEILISGTEKADRWEISVKDNGIGIEKKYFDRIFVIFQRLHGIGEYSGTGVGLAVCKRIVGTHGGDIWLESAPGEGSTFTFSLPKGA